MSKVVVQMSMSVDGFIAGPNPAPDNPLGTNGTKLHDWMFSKPDKGNVLSETLKKDTGAAIIGYTMYREAIPYWGGTGPLGDDIPTFVLTKPENVPQDAPKVFTFVTDGIESALKQAKTAAGDQNVWVGGGANTVQQYLKARLLDELHLHVVPILLGGGTSLFGELGEFMELEKVSAKDAKAVTHLMYRFK